MSRLAFFLALVVAMPARAAVEPKPLKVLFLGDKGHHKPEERFRQLQPVMAKRNIDLVYTGDPNALNAKLLASYDGLLVYANIDKITDDQEKALLDFVASGKGFIPLHCASYCFRNSDKVVALIGAQFQRHDTGTFRVTNIAPDHPIMKEYKGFESWDETYTHTKHNEKDRTVLEVREERGRKEPWTWVRTHEKGRVFYTAWGHDERTWGNPGFQNLVERGIRWACGQDPSIAGAFGGDGPPEMTKIAADVKPFEYVPAKVPFYPPRGGAKDNIARMQKPLPPDESAKHIVHPVGFELKLFAADEQFGGKPIAMNWDERGRLWVCVTVDYPNDMQREGEGRDKILILEDTDNDGKADKITTFADKLSIPTSLTFAHGGIVVTQAPDTLFLKDADGDDKADVRIKLFSGWGTRDTHAGPSNLRYGFDNWIYGIVGYSGFDGEVAGARHRFGQGFFRFKLEPGMYKWTKKLGNDKETDVSVVVPRVTAFEFLRSTSNNSWGVGFSEEGLLFGSTANGCASVFLAIPNRYYEKVRGWSSSVLPNIAVSNEIHPITEKIRQVDWHHGFTAAAGHALYTARAYPKEYWNRTAFVCEPTGHLAATMKLTPKGTDFTTSYGWNLVASDDEWVAPTMAEVGPDGNMWIIDWYAFIVQHNPTPVGFQNGRGNAYETPLRDKKHGRVYRLVPTGAKSEAFTLKDATPEKLVDALKNTNMFWRLHAQRLLVERGKDDVAPALLRIINQDKGVDAIGLNVGVIHALWSMEGLLAINSKLRINAVADCLAHPSPGVRRAVLGVLPREGRSPEWSLALDEDRTLDEPQVRLSFLLALSEMPNDHGAAVGINRMLGRKENFTDRWLPDALTIAAAAHAPAFLNRVIVEARELPPQALQVVAVVAEHYSRGMPVDSLSGLLKDLPTAETRTAEVILAGIAKGWPKNTPPKLDATAEEALTMLFAKLPTGAKGQLVKLANTWGSKVFEKHAAEVSASLFTTVADDKQPEDKRIDAAKQLAEFSVGNAATLEKLLDIITPRTPPQLAIALVEAVGNAGDTGATLLKRYEKWPPAVRAAALKALLARAESTRLLLGALEKGQVQLGELSLDQKQALASHSDKRISTQAKRLLAQGGGLPNADRQKVIDEFKPLLAKMGDPTEGKAMFKKHCANCHQHSGEGNKVGPDLTGMAAHPKEELLVHILDPNRSVEGNFRIWKVVTEDGKTLNGLLASETKTSIEIIDAEAKKHVVQREDIESLTASNKSLMPEGFEKQMNSTEFVNLMEFLTQRGKFLPLPLDKVATIVSTKGMFYSEDAAAERLIFRDWKPKEFKGVPFVLIDPQGDKVPNVVMLYGPTGKFPPKMPKTISLPFSGSAKSIHLLSGVSGWGAQEARPSTVSMTVRLHFEDGATEDHALRNGEHFADYIRRVDVPGSEFAFALRGQQIRYLAVHPKRTDAIKSIEFVKGNDATAPVIMAVTVETK